MMVELLKRYPECVLYSPYNITVHTHPLGLRDKRPPARPCLVEHDENRDYDLHLAAPAQ